MGKLLLRVTLIVAVAVMIDGNQDVIPKSTKAPAFFLKIAKNIPRMGRSIRESDIFEENPDSRESERYNGIDKRRIGYYPEIESRNWQSFPLAIEGPPELWRTLAGYSQDPLDSVTNDFNNEIWSRDKRATK